MQQKVHVAIVMRHPTQMDGPLFAYLTASDKLTAHVYYTSTVDVASPAKDPELGITPDWGQMATSGYHYAAPRAGIMNRLRIVRRLVGSRPDLIIISGYMPLFHLFVALYARLNGVPVGLRSDTTLEHTRSAKRPSRGFLKRLILPMLLRAYTTAHPVGSLAADYLTYYGMARERMFSFPYAVDNDWFHLQSSAHRQQQPALRRDLGIASEALVILGVLKLISREDPLTLIRGFAKFREQYGGPCHLLLVGAGPLLGEIEKELQSEGIKNVSMPGYAPYRDLPMYYAAADVFVHPGASESWGVSVNESMACGVPVILSDRVGSHVDLVREGETGYLFKSGDPLALAEALRILFADPQRPRGMGEKARALVEEWNYRATEESILKAAEFVTADRID